MLTRLTRWGRPVRRPAQESAICPLGLFRVMGWPLGPTSIHVATHFWEDLPPMPSVPALVGSPPVGTSGTGPPPPLWAPPQLTAAWFHPSPRMTPRTPTPGLRYRPLETRSSRRTEWLKHLYENKASCIMLPPFWTPLRLLKILPFNVPILLDWQPTFTNAFVPFLKTSEVFYVGNLKYSI